MVEPLIRDQLNDDKRMFYVENVALKVPDLCPRIKKHLVIYYSNGGDQESEWGREREKRST